MNSPLASVIVPVYNVSPYLSECAASICGQTYSNLEIILVDDGSTDGSGALCDELAEKDPRVQVIHQENRGGQRRPERRTERRVGDLYLLCGR